MMTFVEKDQVEKVRRQSLKPTVFLAALELAYIGNDDVSFIEIGAISRGASNFDRFGIGPAGEHAAFLIEHVAVGRVEIGDELPGNRNSRGNDKGAVGAKGKGGESNAP